MGGIQRSSEGNDRPTIAMQFVRAASSMIEEGKGVEVILSFLFDFYGDQIHHMIEWPDKHVVYMSDASVIIVTYYPQIKLEAESRKGENID